MANAVLDGVDGILLGAETLRGEHPVRGGHLQPRENPRLRCAGAAHLRHTFGPLLCCRLTE